MQIFSSLRLQFHHRNTRWRWSCCFGGLYSTSSLSISSSAFSRAVWIKLLSSLYDWQKMWYRWFKPHAVCYIIFHPNIDRKLELFSIWLQKCAMAHIIQIRSSLLHPFSFKHWWKAQSCRRETVWYQFKWSEIASLRMTAVLRIGFEKDKTHKMQPQLQK